MRGQQLFWMIVLAAAFVVAAIVARFNAKSAAEERSKLGMLRIEIDGLRKSASDAVAAHQREVVDLRTTYQREISDREFKVVALDKVLAERKSQFPWLATAIADLHQLEAERNAKFLETKKHPAQKAADAIREQAKRRRVAELESRILRYRVEYYEKLFPWIVDYVGDDVPDDVVDVSGLSNDENEDPVTRWLTPAEYERLPTVEKYQRALDNWMRSAKSRWEVGRMYERYIGYVYETQGYDVAYTGAVEGFEDMGRDIIAQRGAELLVIQCKYWSAATVIREKHVFQLIGTSIEYGFRLGKLHAAPQLSLFRTAIEEVGIVPVLYTSTTLSTEAKEAAAKLDVRLYESVPIAPYPMIKCNVAQRDGEKIYHLPFDQQYDRVKIEADRGERFVYRISEAENAGFRRAWRWRPQQGD
jgi:hypothetical protein